jgi:hypothetical protein
MSIQKCWPDLRRIERRPPWKQVAKAGRVLVQAATDPALASVTGAYLRQGEPGSRVGPAGVEFGSRLEPVTVRDHQVQAANTDLESRGRAQSERTIYRCD